MTWAEIRLQDEREAVLRASRVLGQTASGVRHVSIDVMDMLAYRDSFHMFENFNKKYDPAGQKHLKTLFLKHDNKFNGRFLAELTDGMSHHFALLLTLSLIELIIFNIGVMKSINQTFEVSMYHLFINLADPKQ